MGESTTPDDRGQAQPDLPATPTSQPRCIRSSELLDGRRELHIRHGNDTYRLILTRNGKLILQK